MNKIKITCKFRLKDKQTTEKIKQKLFKVFSCKLNLITFWVDLRNCPLKRSFISTIVGLA